MMSQAATLLQDISAATPPYPQAYCPQQGHDGYPVTLCACETVGWFLTATCMPCRKLERTALVLAAH